MNVLLMCGDVPPTVVEIHDCNGYMVDGGRNDAEYLAEFMEDEVKNYETYKTCTYVFYFDGEGYVQKSGRRFCAFYPSARVFHGDEHVISL